MVDNNTSDSRHRHVLDGLDAYSAAQSELGRTFARRMRMHPTDSTAIVEILRAEDRGVPLTPARLAERIGMTSSATSILLNRLEDAGHITRRRGHADRRLVTLHSAAVVHEQSGQFFEPLRAELDAVLQSYSPEQLGLIDIFITTVRDTIDAYSRSAIAKPAAAVAAD